MYFVFVFDFFVFVFCFVVLLCFCSTLLLKVQYDLRFTEADKYSLEVRWVGCGCGQLYVQCRESPSYVGEEKGTGGRRGMEETGRGRERKEGGMGEDRSS